MKISPDVKSGSPTRETNKGMGEERFCFFYPLHFSLVFLSFDRYCTGYSQTYFFEKKRSFCGSEGKMGVI